MSRLDRAFGIDIALLVVGLIVAVAGAPLVGLGLLLASVLLLGVLLLFSSAKAWGTPGWTRAYNPGAAYRDARAERDAMEQRDLTLGVPEADEPTSPGVEAAGRSWTLRQRA